MACNRTLGDRSAAGGDCHVVSEFQQPLSVACADLALEQSLVWADLVNPQEISRGNHDQFTIFGGCIQSDLIISWIVGFKPLMFVV